MPGSQPPDRGTGEGRLAVTILDYDSFRGYRNRRIVERVKAGETPEAVAIDLGMMPGNVRRICWMAGLRFLPSRQATRDRNRKIVERVKAGETPKAVAKEFGLSPGWTYKILRRAGRG